MHSQVTVTRRVSSVCAVVALAVALATAPSSAEQQSAAAAAAAGGGGGFGTVLWSVLDGCLGVDSTEPTTVCFKSRALTALDRALARPSIAVAEGVTLAARAGKSLPADLLQAEKADRAALDAANDSDHKSALLDDMLVSRFNDFVSTRSIVLDAQEGRGRRKEQKSMRQAIAMVGIMAVAVLGPMAFGFVATLAGKALLVGTIALVVSGFLAAKKLFQPEQKKPIEVAPHYYSGETDAHNMAYSAHQK